MDTIQMQKEAKPIGGLYFNPLTDFGFKKIFGNEEIMTAFLTDLLQPASPIKHLVFIDKELLPDIPLNRGVIYDMRCETEDGNEFIVEMQNRSQTYFSDRILFYLSRSLSEQGKKGDKDWNFALKPVYGIFLLNFHLDGFQPQAVRTIQLKVNETGELFTEKLRAYTLELPNYKDKPDAYPQTRIEYWMYNLINMETMTKALPFQDKQPIFKKVGSLAELINLSDEELAQYNISLDNYRDTYAVMETEHFRGHAEGLAEGLQKGLAEGLQKGRAEGILNAATNLKQAGILSIEQIAQSLGLSVEVVKNL